ncbi:MAG: hypothetical protein M1378_12090 [Bacteroidetes bacterium]|nr:hypothetical protein [Bacteroidota bacterium]
MDNNKAEEMNWRKAVAFLLRLASIGDPGGLREGDRINLLDDFRRFLELQDEVDVKQELDAARNDPAKLAPAIEVVRKLANAAADHTRAEIHVGETRVVFDGARMDVKGERAPVSIDGKLRDVMASTAAMDLGLAKPWQIGRCQRTECGKLFLADRKGQMYCSHKCATAVSSAKYHEREKAKKAGKKNKRGVK